MLGKSGVVELVRDEPEEEDEVEDAMDGGRVKRPAYAPRLILEMGTATSIGGRCIMKILG